MLPENLSINLEPARQEQDIFQTYKIDWETKRIKGLITNPIEALEQFIIKALRTTRYAYQIYDDQYGLDDVFTEGATDELIKSELERAIKDALMFDGRILEIDNFKFRYEQKEAFVSFEVKSIYGDLDINTKIKVGEINV